MNKEKLARFGLTIIIIGLCIAVVHLMFFAGAGRRYTANDGDIDRQINEDRYTELKQEINNNNKRYDELMSKFKILQQKIDNVK
jgi:uncharacterized protein YlxW (UPF0749 family)